MGLSTHVLDTVHGRPAAGMTVELVAVVAAGAAGSAGAAGVAGERSENGERKESSESSGSTEMRTVLKRAVTGQDGRVAGGLLDAASLRRGRYELVFDVAGYFRALGVTLPEPPFLDRVTIAFGIADTGAHYHVPLLVTPFSYATYRGS